MEIIFNKPYPARAAIGINSLPKGFVNRDRCNSICKVIQSDYSLLELKGVGEKGLIKLEKIG